MDKTTALNSELSVVSRRALQSTVVLWLILVVVSYQFDLTVGSSSMLAISVALSLLPVVLLSKVKFIHVLASRQSRRLPSQIDKPYDVNSLSSISNILIDQSKLMDSIVPTVVEFFIGRQFYTISDTGSGQHGHIQNQHGHNLTTKDANDVKLFLEACHATDSLTSKTDFSQDFSKTKYEVILNLGEDLLVIKRTAQHTIVFARTAVETAIIYSSEIWDHGHVRPLKAADQKHFIDAGEAQAAASRQTGALAYAILPAKTELKDLTLNKLTPDLIFLGLICFDLHVQPNVSQNLRLAKKLDLTVSIASHYPAQLAKSLAVKAGLSRSIKVIPESDLVGLTDDDIRTLLHNGAVFTDLSKAGQRRIHSLAHADERTIIYTGQNWTNLIPAIQASRYFHLNTKKALRCFLTTALSLVLLVIAGAITVLAYHIGPAIIPVQIALVGLLILPLPVLALLDDQPTADYIVEAWRDRLAGIRAAYDFIGFGLLAALIGYGNFLYFFIRNDISPEFIATDTPLYLQATTVTWVTLAVCLSIHLFFERQNTHDKFFNYHLVANRRLLINLGLTLLTILLIIYTPVLAGLAKSAPLNFYDWLAIFIGGSLFFLTRLSQRQTRKHTREVVLKLHSRVHKS